MRAKTSQIEDDSLDPGGDPNTSGTGICAAKYAPSSKAITSKTVAEIPVVTLFDQQKLNLNSNDDTLGKASNNLRGQTLVVVVKTDCNNNDPLSLSQKVLSQAGISQSPFKRHALKFKVTEDMSIDELSAQADADSCVAGITNTGKISTSGLSLPSTNDAYLTNQVHLQYSSYLYAYDYLVKKQSPTAKARVGVLDTGVYCSHSDLSSNLVSGCGINILDATQAPMDNDGHGSHTAGLIGAVTNNGIGIAGTAGNAIELRAIKVIDLSSGNVNDVYMGIQYAIQQDLDVLNVSLQAVGTLPLIEQGIQEAVAAGIVVVMAAGNQGQNLGTSVTVSPARIGKGLPGAITVGSVDTNSGSLSSFSNFGPSVEIAAPGAIDSHQTGTTGGLYSTYKNGGYYRMMGTSQSAPLVTAAAALLVQFFKQHGVSYTPALIENLILQSTDSFSNVPVANNRVINFSKLTRAAYEFADEPLCD